MIHFLTTLLASLGLTMSQADTPATVVQHERVILAEQPGLEDLDAWAAAGVQAVVNSRTPEETAGLDFDMRAEVESRGMRYVELPIGGAYGANPEHTLALTQLLEELDGDIAMHCRSGTRSAHLYSAHLMSQDPSIENPFDVIGWTGGRDNGMVRALTPDNEQ